VTSVSVGGGGPDSFGFFFAVVAALVLIAAWVILAGSRFVQGGVVERPERVPQLYGYTVLLVALVWGLASVLSLVENALVLRNPVYHTESEWGWGEPSVTSFEAFRANYDRAREMRAEPGAARPDPTPEPELRRRFEALRADRVERARVRAQRSLVTSGLSLLIAAALFAFHWRWLRRKVGPLGTAPNSAA
jgi:hypothetical protein